MVCSHQVEMSAGKRQPGEADGRQQQRPRVELKQVACGCDAAWRAAWPDLDAEPFEGNTCVVGSRRLAEAIQRHHFAARADEKGRAPPDLAASNRFAAYGALAAMMATDHKGLLSSNLRCMPVGLLVPDYLLGERVG